METDSIAVHAGRDDFAALGVHAPPIDLSTTYPVPDLDEAVAALDALAAGARRRREARSTRASSTRRCAGSSRRLAELEGTADCVAFASGMAALTACLLAACSERRHVVALRPLYGGSDHLLACGLLGIDVTWTGADGDRSGDPARTPASCSSRRHRTRRSAQVDIAAAVAAPVTCPCWSTTPSPPRSCRTRPGTARR